MATIHRSTIYAHLAISVALSQGANAQRPAESIDNEGEVVVNNVLAATQANGGKFDQAEATISEAIDKAPEGKRELLKRRRQLYEREQPFRLGMLRE